MRCIGGDYSCAVLEGGTATCWGKNPYGLLLGFASGERCEPWYLGNCDVVPKPVLGLDQVEHLQLSRNSCTSCAWLTNGEVKCWGEEINARELSPYQGDVPMCSEGQQATPVEEFMKLPDSERAFGKYVTLMGHATVAKLSCDGSCWGRRGIDDWGTTSECSGKDHAHVDCDVPLGSQVIASGIVRPWYEPGNARDPQLVSASKSKYGLDLARLCIVPGTQPSGARDRFCTGQTQCRIRGSRRP